MRYNLVNNQIYGNSGIICIVLILFSCASVSFGIEIREKEECGKKTVEIENEYYKTVLVPEIARLPLSYYFKLTGHEEFIMPCSLSKSNKGFVYYGGVIDSIPWVSGKVEGKRLPDKGYLYSSIWNYKIGENKYAVWFDGQTSFDYDDPVTGKKSRLFFNKKITGYDGTTQLRMDYLIKNIGKTNAKFTFSIHSRTGIAKWDKGDYFYAPGERCYVYYMNNMPHLHAKGIHPPCWTEWPLKDAMKFNPAIGKGNIFVFLPAKWCVVGDDKYGETLFFIASPIDCSGKEEIMKMGIFMTSKAYVVEPCLTYSIGGNPETWKKPESTVLIKSDKECSFTVNLVAYQGIYKKDVPGIYAVYPECILLDKPQCVKSLDGIKFQGRIAFPGNGELLVKTNSRILKKHKVLPGVFDLSKLGKLKHKDEKNILVFF